MLQTSSTTRNILFVNLICFIVTILFAFLGLDVIGPFALWSPISNNFYLYQIITHQFLHAGIFHILFNMLALVSLGIHVERYIGRSNFLIFYLLCGSVAGMFNLMFTDTLHPMVGASGAIFGIFGFFAMAFPNEKLYAFFIPYGIKARVLLSILIGIEVILALVTNSSDGIGHWAHIGGAVCGYSYFKLKYRNI